MTENEENKFDQHIRQQFDAYLPSVPPDNWQKIQARLDENAENVRQVYVGRTRQKGARGWWISAAATIIFVLGLFAWIHRPVELVYLQAKNEGLSEAKAVTSDIRRPESVAHDRVIEQIDFDKLKSVVSAYRSPRKTAVSRVPADSVLEETREETNHLELLASTAITQRLEVSGPATNAELLDFPVVSVEALEKVPSLKPELLPNDEKESAPQVLAERSFSVSNLLNLIVGAVDRGEEKILVFSNDAEGSLRLGFNIEQAKSRRKHN